MTKTIILMLTNPISADRAPDFEKWYKNVCAPALAKVPGYHEMKFFRAPENQMWDKTRPHEQWPEKPPYRYLALHQVSDMEAFKSAFREGHAAFPRTDAGDWKNGLCLTFEEL